jgi:hypothetical protein
MTDQVRGGCACGNARFTARVIPPTRVSHTATVKATDNLPARLSC